MAERNNKSEPNNNNNEVPKDNSEAPEEEGSKKKELEELPPFEVVEGSRIPASSFMFQFKNVEYSSGRNKTLLCYTVERGEGQVFRGYLEDEHASAHAEEAFFSNVLPQFLSSGALSVICYVSSSPCVNCAACIARCLRRNKTLKIRLVVARLFQWEESEIRGALRGISSAGCQLRMMKSADYLHVWQNFVEPDVALNEEGENEQKSEQGAFIPWEDLEENSRYYEEKLAGILR
ncbi:C-_U-editing enzyme APOBEC-2 [Ranitomeya imitator]|uniref:C->U-editing enzyme APOBEC-2 n=1 Tax=Ranitomeya imitator TaxID=111125 RepID=UPI0037E7ADB0